MDPRRTFRSTPFTAMKPPKPLESPVVDKIVSAGGVAALELLVGYVNTDPLVRVRLSSRVASARSYFASLAMMRSIKAVRLALPVGPVGKVSATSITSGTLKRSIRSESHARSASDVTEAPNLGTTTA